MVRSSISLRDEPSSEYMISKIESISSTDNLSSELYNNSSLNLIGYFYIRDRMSHTSNP